MKLSKYEQSRIQDAEEGGLAFSEMNKLPNKVTITYDTCVRCGRPLIGDFVQEPEGKVCMMCMGGS